MLSMSEAGLAQSVERQALNLMVEVRAPRSVDFIEAAIDILFPPYTAGSRKC
jgi:hypothetical protein